MRVKVCAAMVAAFGVMSGAAPGFAQAADPAYLPDSVSPFGAPPAVAPDEAPVQMPSLAFTPDQAIAADFDKYYAFHRDGTDVDTAFADLVECDSYARGVTSTTGPLVIPYPYAGTMTGAVGGAIAGAMVDAMFGSAERRRLRRVNMRMCMSLKGYDRFGLPKRIWDTFNFDEGLANVGDPKRYRYLRQQAMVASAGRFQGKALGL